MILPVCVLHAVFVLFEERSEGQVSEVCDRPIDRRKASEPVQSDVYGIGVDSSDEDGEAFDTVRFLLRAALC